MKNIFLAIFVLMSLPTFAQSNRSGTFLNATAAGVVKARDTTTNTDTSYIWNGRSDHNQWATVSLKYAVTQITGTTTCTMVIQGSNDATSVLTGEWTTLANYTTGSVGLVDTGTTKNTTYVFQIPNCNYKYLRGRVITGGTQTSIMTGTYYLAAKYIANLN